MEMKRPLENALETHENSLCSSGIYLVKLENGSDPFVGWSCHILGSSCSSIGWIDGLKQVRKFYVIPFKTCWSVGKVGTEGHFVNLIIEVYFVKNERNVNEQ